jgi:hypothetical protein
MKFVTFMYNISQRIVTDHVVRGIAFGTMLQEHLHGQLRDECYGDCRIGTLDLAMKSAVTRQILRGSAGVEGHLDASDKRQQCREARFTPIGDGSELPTLASVFAQLVSALRRTMVQIPPVIEAELETLGVDLGGEATKRAFLHEVFADDPTILVPPRGVKESLTTTKARITATRGLGDLKRRTAAAQLAGTSGHGVAAGGT